MNVRVVCGGCRRVLADQADAYPNDLGNCGSCGSPLKEVTIDIADKVELREEFDATGSNLQGTSPTSESRGRTEIRPRNLRRISASLLRSAPCIQACRGIR